MAGEEGQRPRNPGAARLPPLVRLSPFPLPSSQQAAEQDHEQAAEQDGNRMGTGHEQVRQAQTDFLRSPALSPSLRPPAAVEPEPRTAGVAGPWPSHSNDEDV